MTCAVRFDASKVTETALLEPRTSGQQIDIDVLSCHYFHRIGLKMSTSKKSLVSKSI